MSGSSPSDYFDEMMMRLAPRERAIAAEIFHYLVAPSGRIVAHTAQDLAAYTGVSADDVFHTLRELMSIRIVHPVSLPTEQAHHCYEVFDPGGSLAPAILDWQSRHAARPAATRRRRWIRWQRGG